MSTSLRAVQLLLIAPRVSTRTCISWCHRHPRGWTNSSFLEIRQRVHLGMAVNDIGDNPLEPAAQGTIVELRQTQAVDQDSATRRRWGAIRGDHSGYREWPGPRRTGITTGNAA
jgi:hypothetical protein